MRINQDVAGPLEASVFVEGLRAIPAAFVAIALTAHALIWTFAAQIAEVSPSPQTAVALALGREWLLGYSELPPLGPWISTAIFHATDSFFALRLASSLCVALAGWIAFLFARRVVGERHAAIAVLVMVSVFPVALPAMPLNGDVLQMPLAAAAVLFWWVAVGERNPNGWIAFGAVIGLMAYAGPQAFVLLAVVTVMTVLSPRGRAAIGRFDGLLSAGFALLLAAFVAGPRLLWVWQHGVADLFAGVGAGVDAGEMQTPLRLLVSVLVGHFGLVMLLFLATANVAKENAPVLVREPATLFARRIVLMLAVLPALSAVLTLYLLDRLARPQLFSSLLMFGGFAAVAMAGEKIVIRRQRMVGLLAAIFLLVPPAAQVVFSFAPGWVGENRPSNWPAGSAARTFTEIYHTRTGRPLEYVVGARINAAQIAAISADRPHIYIDADPSLAPWVDQADFKKKGGVVFWEIRGADVSPPADYVKRLPAFVEEAPLRLPWARGGGDPVRLGWAIVPPASSQ